MVAPANATLSKRLAYCYHATPCCTSHGRPLLRQVLTSRRTTSSAAMTSCFPPVSSRRSSNPTPLAELCDNLGGADSSGPSRTETAGFCGRAIHDEVLTSSREISVPIALAQALTPQYDRTPSATASEKYNATVEYRRSNALGVPSSRSRPRSSCRPG